MKAGRELDALVAEKVFGAKLIRSEFHEGAPVVACDFPDRPVGSAFGNLPPYSTDIAAAWEVVEKVGRHWNGFDFCIFSDKGFVSGVEEWRAGWFEAGYGEYEGRADATSDTLPHAICLAALKSVGAL
jgi:hypothetical protein